MPKGHIQSINNIGNEMVDPFGSNVAASQAYKTMERLVTATYMVTNLVPEQEPLRARIRDILNSLLEDTLHLRRGFNSLGSDSLKEIIAQVRLVMSLLDALYTSGLISSMNLNVLKGAFTKFSESILTLSEASSADGVELTPDYFELQSLSSGSDSAGNTKATRVQHRTASSFNNSNTLKSKNNSTSKVPNKQSTSRASKVRVNNIIEFITKRGSANVSELSEVITGCSNKTLQRDLTALVKKSILKKEGSKRWTRYLIA